MVGVYNYYPFGQLIDNPTWEDTDARFGFQGQQRDDEIAGKGNSLATYFRLNSTQTGRWLSIDPKADKYPGASPYTLYGNSPIVMVDPRGDVIKVRTQGGDIEYIPGETPTSDDPFMADVHSAISENMKHDKKNVWQSLHKSDKETLIILETADEIQAKPTSSNNFANGVEGTIIQWNPHMAGYSPTTGGFMTPATILFHEGGHSQRFIGINDFAGIQKLIHDLTPETGTWYYKREEGRNMDLNENPYIRNFNFNTVPPINSDLVTPLQGQRGSYTDLRLFETNGVHSTSPVTGQTFGASPINVPVLEHIHFNNPTPADATSTRTK